MSSMGWAVWVADRCLDVGRAAADCGEEGADGGYCQKVTHEVKGIRVTSSIAASFVSGCVCEQR